MSLQLVSNASVLEEYHPSDPPLKHRKNLTLLQILHMHNYVQKTISLLLLHFYV